MLWPSGIEPRREKTAYIFITTQFSLHSLFACKPNSATTFCDAREAYNPYPAVHPVDNAEGLHVVREKIQRTRSSKATGLVKSMRVQNETGRSSSDSLGSALYGRKKRTKRIYSLVFNCEQRELSKFGYFVGRIPLTRGAREADFKNRHVAD